MKKPQPGFHEPFLRHALFHSQRWIYLEYPIEIIYNLCKNHGVGGRELYPVSLVSYLPQQYFPWEGGPNRGVQIEVSER